MISSQILTFPHQTYVCIHLFNKALFSEDSFQDYFDIYILSIRQNGQASTASTSSSEIYKRNSLLLS